MDEFEEPQVCKCSDNTKYEDLCPNCLSEVLDYMSENESDDEFDSWEYA